MSKREYLIDDEDLRLLNHYKEMFNLNSERVQELCNGEKDDIVYGFELGNMYSHLRDCFMEMIELTDEIKNKEVIKEVKK